jgi:Short C-terminal domain
MRRVGDSRSQLIGVLARPPCAASPEEPWAVVVPNPVKQIEALAELRDRGLLTPEEFARQKTKVLYG